MADRRGSLRRRHRFRRETPSPFTAEQVAEIRRAFSEAGSRAPCPVCGSTFHLGQARQRGAETVRRIQCSGCGKTAIVTNSRLARVIVVSGKAETREALRTIFSSAHHDVVEAADAGVALAAYRAEPADAVFIDVAASGRMTASEFIRQLRKDSPDARVVAMSGRTSLGGANPLAMARQLGAVRTIRVPCPGTEILRVLEEVRR